MTRDYMASNEKTTLIGHVYKNYSNKSHHLHYKSPISRVVSTKNIVYFIILGLNNMYSNSLSIHF